MKYFFLFFTWNVKPCCANTFSDHDCLSGEEGTFLYCLGSCFWNWSVLCDSLFCLMALLYLAGDNLEEMVCEEDVGNCPIVGRVLTGTSLMLNILLALLKGSSTKPNIPSAFLVIGIMGNVYLVYIECCKLLHQLSPSIKPLRQYCKQLNITTQFVATTLSWSMKDESKMEPLESWQLWVEL